VPLVADSSAATAATPKSVSTTRPSRAISTLSGLRSRWTTPTAWAAANASHSSTALATATPAGSGPARSRSVSDSPATSSIVKNVRPSARPSS
jgi:hypothetical protein